MALVMVMDEAEPPMVLEVPVNVYNPVPEVKVPLLVKLPARVAGKVLFVKVPLFTKSPARVKLAPVANDIVPLVMVRLLMEMAVEIVGRFVCVTIIALSFAVCG